MSSSRERDLDLRLAAHPYLGEVSLDQAIRFIAVHARHHAAFLPGGSPTQETLQ